MVLLKFSLSLSLSLSLSHLHSTMVLLKSDVYKKLRENYIKSTFHYGSIKITENNKKKARKYQSTFHYGSIKIMKLH